MHAACILFVLITTIKGEIIAIGTVIIISDNIRVGKFDYNLICRSKSQLSLLSFFSFMLKRPVSI
jgi:hypothetical protein